VKRHFKTTLLLFCATAFLFLSCQKENDNSVNAVVNVELPSDFPATVKYNGTVELKSTTTDKTYKVEAKDGKALFSRILPDIYNVYVNKTVSLDDFKIMAPDLAGSAGIILNGTTKNFQVTKSGSTEISATVSLDWCVQSELLISKLYWNGSKYNKGTNENMCKSMELFNNTDHTIYLDGLCIALVHGNTTSANPCALYTTYKDATYCSQIARFDGTKGTTTNIPLEKGKSIVVALIAKNYIVTDEGDTKYTMAQNLASADYEIFSTATWFIDNPDVKNLTPVYSANPMGGLATLYPAFVLFYATQADIDSWETGVDESSYTVTSQKAWKAKRVPNSIIIDAVETYKKDSYQQKRIPDLICSQGISGVNNEGSIFDRKILYIDEDGRIVLKDTNNSSSDFIEIASRDRANYSGAHLMLKDYSKPEIQPNK
jgi:hypothetical protein